MSNIDFLIDNLTYDNWFTQVAVIGDAYEESGESDAALVCKFIVTEQKTPVNKKWKIASWWSWCLVSDYLQSNSLRHTVTVLPCTVKPRMTDVSSGDQIKFRLEEAIERMRIWLPYSELRLFTTDKKDKHQEYYW